MENQESEEKNKDSLLKKDYPTGSFTKCPLIERTCVGMMCALWLNPENNALHWIPEMCLVRLALKKIAGA